MKKLLYIIFLLPFLASAQQYPNGIKVGAPIIRNATTDAYPTGYSVLLNGGRHSYATLAGRDSLNTYYPQLLRDGMEVYIRATDLTYRWNNSTSAWNTVSYGLTYTNGYGLGLTGTQFFVDTSLIRTVANSLSLAQLQTRFNTKQNTLSLTTTGTSGAATFNPTTGALNIPQYTTDLSGENLQTVTNRGATTTNVVSFNPTISASGGVARGLTLTGSYTQTAGGDNLSAFDINPAFNYNGLATVSFPATTGLTNGTYTNIDLTGSGSSGAKLTVVVSGGTFSSMTVTSPGNGYAVGLTYGLSNTLFGGTGTSNITATSLTLSSAFIYGLRVLNGDVRLGGATNNLFVGSSGVLPVTVSNGIRASGLYLNDNAQTRFALSGNILQVQNSSSSGGVQILSTSGQPIDLINNGTAARVAGVTGNFLLGTTSDAANARLRVSGTEAGLTAVRGALVDPTLTPQGNNVTLTGVEISPTFGTGGTAITPGAQTFTQSGTATANGTLANTQFTGGTGTGALATVVISGLNVTSVTVTNGGSGYTVGDALTSTVNGKTVNFTVASVGLAGIVNRALTVNNGALNLGFTPPTATGTAVSLFRETDGTVSQGSVSGSFVTTNTYQPITGNKQINAIWNHKNLVNYAASVIFRANFRVEKDSSTATGMNLQVQSSIPNSGQMYWPNPGTGGVDTIAKRADLLTKLNVTNPQTVQGTFNVNGNANAINMIASGGLFGRYLSVGNGTTGLGFVQIRPTSENSSTIYQKLVTQQTDTLAGFRQVNQLRTNQTPRTGSYTANIFDRILQFDNTAGGATLALPPLTDGWDAVNSRGSYFTVVKTAGANAIPVSVSGASNIYDPTTGANVTTYNVTNSAMFYCDGTRYVLVKGNDVSMSGETSQVSATSYSFPASRNQYRDFTSATLCTATLPSSNQFGDIIEITASGTGGVRLGQNSGDVVFIGAISTTAGATGYTTINTGGAIRLRCTQANTGSGSVWRTISSTGTITPL